MHYYNDLVFFPSYKRGTVELQSEVRLQYRIKQTEPSNLHLSLLVVLRSCGFFLLFPTCSHIQLHVQRSGPDGKLQTDLEFTNTDSTPPPNTTFRVFDLKDVKGKKTLVDILLYTLKYSVLTRQHGRQHFVCHVKWKQRLTNSLTNSTDRLCYECTKFERLIAAEDSSVVCHVKQL